MIRTARQLKDLIRNLSKEKSADAHILRENFRLSRQTLELQAYSQVSPLNLLPIYYDCGQSFDMPRNLASTEPQKQVQPPDCTAHQSWTNKLEKIE